MKNRLTDLNDHLFMQLERLGDEDLSADKLDAEVKRSEAMVAVADQIIANANTQLKAVKIIADHGDRFKADLPMIASRPEAPVRMIGEAKAS